VSGRSRACAFGAPYAEIDVSDIGEGDFRDDAAELISAFKRKYGRLPNYVAVRLGQVEALEAAYDCPGIMECYPPGVPLLFVGP
jgi:hypothetical protein